MCEAAGPGEDRGDGVGRGLLALLVLAVVAGHGAVGGLRLDGACRPASKQHRGHQAERAEALRHDVGLHVAVIVLAGPDVAAGPLQGRCDHVVDQAVLVGDLAASSNSFLEFGVVDLLEDILAESAVILP
jgi:hypothetical protein